MKNKKWISLAAAIVLAVTALPMTAFAAKKDGEKKLAKVTLNEVAHSIFYAPQYVAIEEGYFEEEGLDLQARQISDSWERKRRFMHIRKGQPTRR